MKKRLGILGGTFDPIHNGHIVLAREFAARLQLDAVLMMPTFVPPHKVKPDLAPAVDRLEMCRLACEPYPELIVSDMEINRRGASFTVTTLEQLKALDPNTDLFLLVGADMFLTLATWHRFADIAKLATLCVAPRDGSPTNELRAYAEELEKQGAACCVETIDVPYLSSTDIRERAAAEEPIDDMVPQTVAEYISEHGLYTANKRYCNVEDQYRDIIRGRLTPKRYIHSLAVADQAEYLAAKYGADTQKARVAGLLHDILKDTDRDSQLQILQDFDILLDTVEKKAPKLWHARAGAVFVENILGIHDTEILNAIRYHTTGRAGMSLLEIVLYLADFTSADRDYPDVDVMRRLSEEDLHAAMDYALAYTIADLREQGRDVHPDTLACYQEWQKG